MLGAMFGDMVGAPHEFIGTKSRQFDYPGEAGFATDDSYLTLAVAECVLEDSEPAEYVRRFHAMVRRFPNASWGTRFLDWALRGSTVPYNSWGNGSAMRVSPVGFAFDSESQVLEHATRSAEVTHNHPEGVKGAQATALAIFLARQRRPKDEIRQRIADFSGYDLNRTVESIRPTYKFNESCQQTVPEAIVAFLDAADFEDSIRNAISLGGDADTLAAITGGIAHAYFGFPNHLRSYVQQRLPQDLWQLAMRFESRFALGET
jgi:ADP-ribosylglycohydrolase